MARLDMEALEQAAWAVALRLRRFGYGEIQTGVGCSLKSAETITRAWAARGAVVVAQPGGGNVRKLFEVAPGTVVPAEPRGRSAEDNMWLAMRKGRSFSPTELALCASSATIPVDTAAAAAYCRALLASGHLVVARKAEPPRREAIYRLVRETGVLAPRERRVRAVVDPNDGTIVPIEGGRA